MNKITRQDRKEKLIQALVAFNNAAKTLNLRWSQFDDDQTIDKQGMIGADEFCFEKSFDEVAEDISVWTESFLEELKIERYYVATISTYVLVDSINKEQAKQDAIPLLSKLLNREVKIEDIRISRIATDEEIETEEFFKNNQ